MRTKIIISGHSTGWRIGFFRHAANLTTHELAEKLGVSDRTLYNWESDETSPPMARLKSLAKALRCDPCDLIS